MTITCLRKIKTLSEILSNAIFTAWLIFKNIAQIIKIRCMLRAIHNAFKLHWFVAHAIIFWFHWIYLSWLDFRPLSTAVPKVWVATQTSVAKSQQTGHAEATQGEISIAPIALKYYVCNTIHCFIESGPHYHCLSVSVCSVGIWEK